MKGKYSISEFRKTFTLDSDWIHLGLGILAPHSMGLNEQINQYRAVLDANPDEARRHRHEHNQHTLQQAAHYLGVNAENVILTESTTLSLALVFLGFRYQPADEILMSHHEHYSVDSLGLHAAERFGVKVKKFDLFTDGEPLTEAALVSRYLAHINENTRLVSITWVNSCFGVKLPVTTITAAIQRLNAQRAPAKRIFTVLDAVHGIGIENIASLHELGVDYVASGCHKWLFGPRGTGFLWASDQGWQQLSPLIPSFEAACWQAFMGDHFVDDYARIRKPLLCTPGGFRHFEHQWALGYAFETMMLLGKDQVEHHIHKLASLAKAILQESKNITLYTPESAALSSGFVCFNLHGACAEAISQRFKQQKIMLGYTPYKTRSLRLAAGLLNTEDEVMKVCNMLLNMA